MQPPPPPPVVRHKRHQRHKKAKALALKQQQTPTPKPPSALPIAKPVLVAAAPVETENGPSVPAILIAVFGILLSLVAVSVSAVPPTAVPYDLRLRLDESRQRIMLIGLAIGVPCALIGSLVVLATR